MENKALVSDVRIASRNLVRQFGLMNQGVAGTDLSLSAVHAIIEIGLAQKRSARDLCDLLLLEKSTVSRLVRQLIKRGDVIETRSTDDLRMKMLSLTPSGKKTLKTINRFAESQVSNALAKLDKPSQQGILKGLQDYSSALANDSHDTLPNGSQSSISIHPGYQTGIIGFTIGTLSAYMNRHFDFNASFETRISSDMCEFIHRLESPQNEIWYAETEGRIVGSISIDGEDLGNNQAHLRWFVVDDAIQGKGVGEALLTPALEFCDATGFDEIHLWTVKGLDAARNLYLRHGFHLAEEYLGDQWGREILEHRYVRVKS